MTLFPPEIKRAAEISPCGKYRYALKRWWDESKGSVLWVMLNPSTADAERDDATIKKCMGFARRWGFGGIWVANLFNWRATDPRELSGVPNPCLPGGYGVHLPHAQFQLIVVAWGVIKSKPFKQHAMEYLTELRKRGPVHCLQITEAGWPWHPLYVPYETSPILYQPRGVTL